MRFEKILVVVSLAALAPLAGAQSQTPAQADGQGRSGGQRGERPSPEKMRQMFDERFKKADADGDGALSRAEAEKSMPMLARDFDKIDANRDGKVTQDEIRAAMEKRHAEMKDRMKNREGGVDGKGRGPMSQEEREKRGDEMFRKADTNGDGALSQDEAAKSAPFLSKNFAAIDADKDGKLSRDEIRAWGDAQRKAFEAKRAAGKGDSAPK